MKILKLSNNNELYVCDYSNPEKIVNVFKTEEEAEAFQSENLTFELLDGAFIGDLPVTLRENDMSIEVSEISGNVTATYTPHVDEPEVESETEAE